MQDWESIDKHRAAIEKRAYEIYLQRGARDGNDLDDWLTAEREIAARAKRERPDAEIPRARAAVATRIIEGSH